MLGRIDISLSGEDDALNATTYEENRDVKLALIVSFFVEWRAKENVFLICMIKLINCPSV